MKLIIHIPRCNGAETPPLAPAELPAAIPGITIGDRCRQMLTG